MVGKILFLLLALSSSAYCDSRIRFLFYFGSDTVEIAMYNVTTLSNVLQHPSFDHSKITVMFHYGAGQSISTAEIHDLILSYLFNRQYNFIVVSYEQDNIVSTENAVVLAQGITEALTRLFDSGYNAANMNLIGFSLGAQIVARAARFVRSTTGNRHIVGRLTGLDPGALGPINIITIGRLNSGDAAYVESIHTEGNQRGDLASVGHVRFIVNGGVEQPMCTQISPIARWDCSHIFAVQIWSESVISTTLTFPALACNTWEAYVAGECNSNSIGHMGRTTNPTQGIYMFRTNLNRPWSRDTPFP